MSFRNRELEVKISVTGVSLDSVNKMLRTVFEPHCTRSVYGSSTDTYYTIRNPDVRADFLRIRQRDDGSTEITVKGEDRGNVLDRMEIDIHSATKSGTIMKLFNAALGKSSGIIRKTYHVYWLDEHTTISCYQLTEPVSDTIYIEVEATSEEKVMELEAQVMERLQSWKMAGTRAEGSLWSMFIKK